MSSEQTWDSSNGFDVGASTAEQSTKAPAATTAATAPRSGVIQVQPLQRADMQPSYKQNLGLDTIEHGFYGSMMNGIGAVAGFFGQLPFCFCCPNPYKEVQQGSVGLVSRFGQFFRSEDPGLVRINPCSESLKIVNVMITVCPIPKQQVMTRDSVSIGVDSVLFYHVSNPYRAAYGIADVRTALVERAQTTLRNVVGARTLQSLISDREQVALEIQEIVEGTAEKWGVQVESILIKDIEFSKELQESLSSAATQKRIGEAKVIASRAEVEVARSLRQASSLLATPAAMQYRQLDALQAMAKGANRVIFVPMHLDLQGTANLANQDQNQAAAALAGEPLGISSASGPSTSAPAPTTTSQDGQGLSMPQVASLQQLTQM